MPTQRLADFLPLGPEALERFFRAANAVVFRESRAARVERLSPEASHLYLAYVLNAEVLNGGYSQFFSNTSGEWVPETLNALRALQAPRYLELLEAALVAFGGQAPPRDQVIRCEQLAAFEAQHPSTLNQLDDAHYGIIRADSLEGSMQRYLAAQGAAPLETTAG